MNDEAGLPQSATVRLPPAWQRTATGEAMPDVVAAVQRARSSR